MKQRLQKVLAQAGFGSRRNCEKLITSSRVKVNKKIITKLGFCVDLFKDVILVDNLSIYPEKLVYLILNKPKGYLTTLFDPQKRPCIKDLILSLKERVYPAGRLDQDAVGLILLTNDGRLVYKITHPNFKVEKTYQVKVKGICSETELQKFSRPVKLGGNIIAPAKLKILKKTRDFTLLEVKIFQGIKHQIKKMFHLIGYKVVKLKRIKIGNLKLDKLPEGKWRYLSIQEVNKLKRMLESVKKEGETTEYTEDFIKSYCE